MGDIVAEPLQHVADLVPADEGVRELATRTLERMLAMDGPDGCGAERGSTPAMVDRGQDVDRNGCR